MTLVILTLLAGCSEPVVPPVDAVVAIDARPSIDAGLDAPTDAPPDAPRDVGIEAERPECAFDEQCAVDSRCFVGTCTDGSCVVSPVACDDGAACTTDACDPASGCVSTPIDADGDGTSACSDCDDGDATIEPGAPETCDGDDDDCDGTPDDGLERTWYADCDGDGVTATGAATASACAPPAIPVTGCTGASAAWSEDDPSSFPDCDDANPAVRPARAVYETAPIAGRPPETDFDYDCSGSETRRYTTLGSCTPLPDGSFGCTSVAGWVGGAIAECGASASYATACSASPGPAGVECNPITETRTQGCF